MPAEKSHRASLRKQTRNKSVRSATRSAIAKARLSVEEDEGKTKGEENKTAVLEAVKTLDRAAQKGIIHPNNAARRKSRLMKQLKAGKA
ncbi:MAG: 30S ribosomal protein S20 [SAR202 cluster bacterium]|nr:30S ribosomal protein S20 [SAR202 cluster bacterium]